MKRLNAIFVLAIAVLACAVFALVATRPKPCPACSVREGELSTLPVTCREVRSTVPPLGQVECVDARDGGITTPWHVTVTFPRLDAGAP